MSSARRPDVIVAMLGAVRSFDASAVWDDCPPTTPRLTALATESLVFRQATSTSAWQVPAHASLMTGLMPSRHGAHERATDLLSDGPPTLAELLAADGYQTCAISADPPVSHHAGLHRGYAVFRQASGPRVPQEQPPAPGRVGLFRRSKTPVPPPAPPRNADAIALTEAALRDADPARPLHLLVSLGGALLPYRPSDGAARRFLDDADLAAARAVDQDLLHHITGAVLHTGPEWRLLRGLYRAAVHDADMQLGRLLDILAAAGRLDGALLVVTAAHGENVGEHGLMDHHWSLNDTVLRVPMLVRLPGAAQADERPDLAQLIDIVPTACEVAGTTAPPTQGHTLTQQSPRTHAVAEYVAPHAQLAEWMQEYPHVDWSPYDRGLRSIRTAERKYISASDGGNELYDLAADPYERDNRFGRHPDEVALARALRRWEQSEGAVPLGGVVADTEVTERLRALGYIE